jgi:hypothetical protein
MYFSNIASVAEPRLQVGDLCDQDRGTARRLEIGNVLHRHHGGLREQPTKTGGVDSLGVCGIDAKPMKKLSTVTRCDGASSG